jgi:hypothetical protein
MSRFADPTRTGIVPLGPCQCPGTPHDRDEAVVRWDLGSSALARIGRAELDKAITRDPLAAWRQLILEAVVSWNLMLVDDDGGGVAAPLIPAVIAELDDATITTLAEAIDTLIGSRGTLPNASGAPSVASSPGSASPAPKRTRKPTT